MTTETIETTPQQADPEIPEAAPTQTETPAPVGEESAAATLPESAAAPEQVQVTEPEKSQYLTLEQLEERDRKRDAEVSARAAADALELDKRRRQTEGARLANQQRREAEELAELHDTAKTAFGAAGIFEIPEEPIVKAVDRMVKKRSEQIATGALDAVGPVLEYLGGTTDDLSDEHTAAARYIRPAVQAFVERARTLIETNARKGYIAESELPKLKQTWAEEQAAHSKEGLEELKRVEGAPPPPSDSTIAERLDRIGTPRETPADRQWWNERERARGRR